MSAGFPHPVCCYVHERSHVAHLFTTKCPSTESCDSSKTCSQNEPKTKSHKHPKTQKQTQTTIQDKQTPTMLNKTNTNFQQPTIVVSSAITCLPKRSTNPADNITRIGTSHGINQMIPLPYNFLPGPFDVICAKGKDAKKHQGNLYFRSLVKKSVNEYSQASTRIQKSMIVSNIIDAIRQKSPNGGFVKEEAGLWYDVGDHHAREKVGQTLRDSLHNQYRSSTKAKRQRKQELDLKMRKDLEAVIEANEEASRRMEELSSTLQQQSSHVCDEYLLSLMTETNRNLLDSFKNDETLQEFAREQCLSSIGTSVQM